MKKLAIVGAVIAAVLGLGLESGTAQATSNDLNNTEVFDVVSSNDNTSLKMGANLFLAGNDVMEETTARGILFVAGNIVQPKTKSEYGFICGNDIDLQNTKIEKDLFIAGNSITIDRGAEIGRDVFAAGNQVAIRTNLKGSFSATADTVNLNDVKIDGDVNLSVRKLTLSGEKVEITGKLIINADAEIVTSAKDVSYREIEKYEVVRDEDALSGMIIGQAVSIVGIFVAFAIVLAIFPRVNKKVAAEISGAQLILDLLIGLCALVLIPVVSILLVFTFFAAPAGIMLILAYLIMIFLAQGFTGLWLGKLIMESALSREANKYLEALIGIIILGLASMIPMVGGWIGFFSLILGLGLIIQSIRRKPVEKKFNFGPYDDTETVEAKVVKSKSKTSKTSPSTRKTTTRKSKTPKAN